MISNNMCEKCDKAAVCKIADILFKFSDEAKKQLGVDISMDSCINFEPDVDTAKNPGEDE